MFTTHIRPILIASAVIAVFTAGCSDNKQSSQAPAAPEMAEAPPPAPVTTMAPATADTAITAAKAAIKAASANNWIWRDTAKFLKEAEAAAEKGDEAAAIKLANKARDQADIAISQYKIEQGMNRSP